MRSLWTAAASAKRAALIEDFDSQPPGPDPGPDPDPYKSRVAPLLNVPSAMNDWSWPIFTDGVDGVTSTAVSAAKVAVTVVLLRIVNVQRALAPQTAAPSVPAE